MSIHQMVSAGIYILEAAALALVTLAVIAVP